MSNLLPIVYGLVGMLVTLVGYVFVTTIQDLKKRVYTLEEGSVTRAIYTGAITKLEKAFKDDIGSLEEKISILVASVNQLSDWKVYEEGKAAGTKSTS